MEERLQKIIARSGLASRRQAEQMIAEGRVKVGGEVVTQAGRKVDPSGDDIRVDGVRVRPERLRRYLLLNKPVGYLTTRSDPRRRRTVMQLLPISLRSLFPVGRLDMATSGLLLLTDDGDFAQRVAHPRYGITKTYALTVWGNPSELNLERAKRGIRVEGQWLRVASVRKIRAPKRNRGAKPRKPVRNLKPGAREKKKTKEAEKSRLRVVLSEGRYREIWRLFKALGHPVIELHREKVGFLDDKGLPPGAFRPLTPREISGLVSPRSSRMIRGRANAGRNRAVKPRRAREPGSQKRRVQSEARQRAGAFSRRGAAKPAKRPVRKKEPNAAMSSCEVAKYPGGSTRKKR